jgi:hypothetical protein
MELCERADIVLVGDSQAIRAALHRPSPHLTIEHAAHHLTGADTLADVLRRRPDSLAVVAGNWKACATSSIRSAIMAPASSA